MNARSSRLYLALVALASLAGCGPHYEALTVPPPFVEAELCDGSDTCGGERTIKLTKGIALAIECKTANGTPCNNVTATPVDGEVATVFEGYLDTLSPATYYGSSGTTGARPRSVFVVVGRAAGTTSLRVQSDEGDNAFAVTIVEL